MLDPQTWWFQFAAKMEYPFKKEQTPQKATSQRNIQAQKWREKTRLRCGRNSWSLGAPSPTSASASTWRSWSCNFLRRSFARLATWGIPRFIPSDRLEQHVLRLREKKKQKNLGTHVPRCPPTRHLIYIHPPSCSAPFSVSTRRILGCGSKPRKPPANIKTGGTWV